MGSIRTSIARRRNERKLQSRVRASLAKPGKDIEYYIDPYINQGKKIYSKLHKTLTDPQSKARGKAITKNFIMHNLVGDGYRAVMGPKSKKRRRR